MIVRALKRRLDDAKGNWVDHLDHILWAYRTTPHSSTNESPFRLTYGQEAVILVEIGEPSLRVQEGDQQDNGKNVLEELDFLDERRAVAQVQEEAAK